MKIRLTARAAEHVRAVDTWWRAHRADMTAFIDEFNRAVELLMTAPDLGAIYTPKAAFGVRRLLLSRSQHYLYYVHRRDRHIIQILAVWSCFRGRGPRLGLLERR
jgi:plasmid stabilization system protein ParE